MPKNAAVLDRTLLIARGPEAKENKLHSRLISLIMIQIKENQAEQEIV